MNITVFVMQDGFVSNVWCICVIALCIRAARQSQIFSAGDYFDAFFDAEHENHKKKLSKIGNNWLFGAKVLIYCQKISVFVYFF